MAAPYSTGLRKRAVSAALKGGLTRAEVARQFDISEATLYTWLRRWKEEATLEPLPHAGGPQPSLDEAVGRLGRAAERPHDRRVPSPGGRTPRGEPEPFGSSPCSGEVEAPEEKKTLRAAEQDRADVQQKRAAFRAPIAGIDVRALVFVDESGIDTHMVRRYARAAPGERAHGSVPLGGYKRLTILGGLAAERLLGVMSIPAATDTPVFLAYLDHVLIPKSVERSPRPLWYWTTSSHSWCPRYARSSRPQAWVCSICRPTRPTSLRSSRPRAS